MRLVLVTALVVLVLVSAFTYYNRQEVSVVFFGWRWVTSLAFAMLASAVVGAMFVYVASLAALGGLRGRLRAAESRMREWERERAARSERPAEPRG